jgi:dTDP-4-amino-4,6-dideoxygalactose transaminase
MKTTIESSSSPVTTSRTKTPSRFPFLDLKAQHASIAEEVSAAVNQVLARQELILGPEVRLFEEEVGETVGAKFCISCGSGSDALLLALMALELKPGDEVITTPFTFVATAGSIARTGATPVFVDIDPHSFNIATDQLASSITERTRAIMPVHLFGLPADMASIMEIAKSFGIAVVEDSAQAIGARYHGRCAGTIGDIGCFSFFPSKNLGGAGDGGMLCTDDRQLADRARILRVHGSREKYHYERLGINSRLDTLQAAILRVKLKYLEAWNAARSRNAARYTELITESALSDFIVLPATSSESAHIFNQFVIRARDRDGLRQYLASAGIPTEIYYPVPLHLQPAFAYLGYNISDLPECELACKEVLALPVYPEIRDEQIKEVVHTISEFYGSHVAAAA